MPAEELVGYNDGDVSPPQIGTLNSGGGENGAVLLIFGVSSVDGAQDTWSMELEVSFPDASPAQDIFNSLSLTDVNGAPMVLNSDGTATYGPATLYNFTYTPAGDNEASWIWSFYEATYQPLAEGDVYTITVT